jgi:hypothetical protein
LRGFPNYIKSLGYLGQLGEFFYAAQNIWAFWSIPEKMFSRMLEKFQAFLEFKVCLGRL